jgi:peptide/nickel transport system substrate-binding protein
MEDGIDPIYDWGAYGESLVFSSLLYRDQDMNVTKDLATDYSVSEDGLVWTVKLRRDASFTDGTPVTARDVVYTYNSLPDITLCKLYCFI